MLEIIWTILLITSGFMFGAGVVTMRVDLMGLSLFYVVMGIMIYQVVPALLMP